MLEKIQFEIVSFYYERTKIFVNCYLVFLSFWSGLLLNAFVDKYIFTNHAEQICAPSCGVVLLKPWPTWTSVLHSFKPPVYLCQLENAICSRVCFWPDASSDINHKIGEIRRTQGILCLDILDSEHSIYQLASASIFARSLCRSHLGIGHIYSIILEFGISFKIYMNCCVQLWGTLLLPPSQDNGFENIQTVSPLFYKFMSADKFWLVEDPNFLGFSSR